MSTRKNLITLCFAAVFTLGLAACGGGGGGDAPLTDMDDGDIVDNRVPMIVGEVIPSGTTLMLPAGLVANITVSDVEEGTSVPVPGVGSFDCVTGPCTVVVADNVVTTTGDIKVVSLADDLPADVLTALEDAIAPAGPAPEEIAAEAAAAAVAATKAAGTKAKLIAAWDAPGTLGGLPDGDDGAYTLTIKRNNPTTVEIKDPAMPRTTDRKFELAEDLGDGRFMFVRTQDADEDGDVEEEVVIVGTDIRAPRALLFARAPGQALNARDLDPSVDADEDGSDIGLTNDYTALFVGVDASADPTPEVVKLVKSDDFAAPTVTTLMFFNDVGDTEKDEASMVDGTYNGATGTYRCNGDAACTASITMVKGKPTLTAMSSGWVFTPDEDETSDVADSSYLHYGVWLKKTTDEDGVLTYNAVETFAGASTETELPPSGDVSGVTGSASYTGDAVGVYVHNVLSDGGGMVESSTSGHFKADASLTATFGQIAVGQPNENSIPPSLLNTITGTINNFDLSGDEANDWSVNLAKSDGETFAAGTASGDAHGGGATGSYSATFHGDVTVVEQVVPQPSAVVGEFNAHFSNGSVAGGFGANKQ